MFHFIFFDRILKKFEDDISGFNLWGSILREKNTGVVYTEVSEVSLRSIRVFINLLCICTLFLLKRRDYVNKRFELNTLKLPNQ